MRAVLRFSPTTAPQTVLVRNKTKMIWCAGCEMWARSASSGTDTANTDDRDHAADASAGKSERKEAQGGASSAAKSKRTAEARVDADVRESLSCFSFIRVPLHSLRD